MFNIVRNVRKNKQHKVKKMNNRKKSRKLLLITTVLTIIALASVLFVYAAVTLGTFQGGSVTVGGITGSITYSSDNNPTGTWTPTLRSGMATNSWYARFEVTSSSYIGSATIT